MTIESVDLQTLFATPLLRADIGFAITPEQIEYIKNLKMIKNQQNLISEDLYIFNRPELKGIADGVQEALDVYAQNVLGIDQRLVVTQSWALINQPNIGMHAHSHSNSIVSGSLYYCELPEPVSRVIFDKYTAYQQIELIAGDGKANIYNTPRNVITPKQNEVILFPSDINHMVESNGSNELRRAIAFNSFVRGKIGNFRDVSELTV